ncbi:unnamed protein product [Lactuca virosa]|uniref:Uncharacterized protein n=1 Tax=Lactuca virosa TaxID=75947 RepID=A0AAU9P9G3_9ASTR|nr:unnamed protein product [Lactuca virosa]
MSCARACFSFHITITTPPHKMGVVFLWVHCEEVEKGASLNMIEATTHHTPWLHLITMLEARWCTCLGEPFSSATYSPNFAAALFLLHRSYHRYLYARNPIMTTCIPPSLIPLEARNSMGVLTVFGGRASSLKMIDDKHAFPNTSHKIAHVPQIRCLANSHNINQFKQQDQFLNLHPEVSMLRGEGNNTVIKDSSWVETFTEILRRFFQQVQASAIRISCEKCCFFFTFEDFSSSNSQIYITINKLKRVKTTTSRLTFNTRFVFSPSLLQHTLPTLPPLCSCSTAAITGICTQGTL